MTEQTRPHSPRSRMTFNTADPLSLFGLSSRRSSAQRNSHRMTTSAILTPKKSGFLQVKAVGFMGGWKKRWVVLQGYDLFVYEDQKIQPETKPRIHLQMAHVVMVSPPMSGDSTTKKGVSFEVFDGERSYVLHTETTTEGEEWLQQVESTLHDARLMLHLSLNLPSTSFIRNGYLLVTKVDAQYSGSVLQIRPDSRWLDLQPTTIQIFTHATNSHQTHKPIDSIDLSRASLEIPKESQSSAVHFFTLHTSQHDYIFRGGTEAHILSWIVSLKRNLHQLRKSFLSRTYHEGRLVKQSNKAWKGSVVAWFVLKDGIMYRYVHDKVNVPDRTVSLEGCSVRLITERGAKPGFVLDTHDKSFRFEASTREDAEKWVEALENSLNKHEDTSDPIIKQGYLLKDPKGVVMKAKYRWFVLRPSTLNYYVKPSDTDPICSYNTKDISVSTSSSAFGDDPCFYLNTAKRTYVMTASSKEEMNSWLQGLQQVTQINSTSWFHSDIKGIERSRALSCPARLQDTPITIEEKMILGGDANLPTSRKSSVASIWNEAPRSIGQESEDFDDDMPLEMSHFNDLWMATVRNRSETVVTVKTLQTELTEPTATSDVSLEVPPPKPISGTVTSLDDSFIECARSGAMFQLDRGNREAHPPIIVMDSGSCWTRMGFAGNECPTAIFPTSTKYVDDASLENKSAVHGFRSSSKQKTYYFDSPMDPKRSTNWDDLVPIWQYGFDHELHLPTEERGILMIEPSGTTFKSREKLLEIFFETFQVPCFALKSPSLLSLVALEMQSGLVVNWGNKLQIAAISNGYMLPNQTIVRNFGGGDLTEMMLKLLNRERSHEKLFTKADACWVKEQTCYLSPDFSAEIEKSSSGSMALDLRAPYSQQDLSICAERFICPEALFDPSLLRLDSPGIHEMVYDTIMDCDMDSRRALFQNIVLCGGTSMLPGFGHRLQIDVQKLMTKNSNSRLTCNVVEKPNRKYLPFIGGTKYAARSEFADNCFYINDYYEHGSSILNM